MLKENEETGCCKRFNPGPWKDTEVNFTNKLFIKDHVMSVFHIPINYGKVMKNIMDKIEKAGAKAKEPLVLTDENSFWGSDVYIAVEKVVPGCALVKIQGNFLSKVFEGSYSNLDTWIREMKNFVKSKDKVAGKIYFYYTTCPACAKAYGKNYTVLFAEIQDGNKSTGSF